MCKTHPFCSTDELGVRRSNLGWSEDTTNGSLFFLESEIYKDEGPDVF